MTLELRAPRDADLAALTEVMNQPGVRAGTLRLPHTGERLVKRLFFDAGPNTYVLVGAVDGQAIAAGALIRKGGRRAHAAEVVLFVHDDHQGRGHGRKLLAALLDLADNWLGLTRVELDVNTDNAAAIHLYEEAGFNHEGTRRADTLRDGVLIDSHVMGRLRPPPKRAAEGSG
ncbi:MAG: GNAT family N-acetyltransferase [Pseudomonadota bacterium]